MIDGKKSGYLVKTKSGKFGRTIHGKGIINGKIPVYLATEVRKHKDHPEIEIPIAFAEKAILCDPKGLTHIGFID